MHSARVFMFALSLITTPAICQGEDADTGENTRSGPVSVDKASVVRLVFGGGFSWRYDDFADFKNVAKDDIALFIDNDSKMRVTAIAGALFKVSENLPLDLLLSLEFAEGTQKVLDSLLLGIGISY